jgi:O-methyltransferase
MKRLFQRIFGRSPDRFFFPGVRLLLRFHAAFGREIALEQGMEFVRHHSLEGDYAEFGVFEGRIFSAACELAQERSLKMHFWAFDSFEGLPVAEGEFAKGSWRSDEARFKTQARRHVRDPQKLHVIKGWFSDTLVDGNPDLAALRKISIAWIDCDLYESTVPVLSFLTARLVDGSQLFFDDWFCLKGHPNRGEQRACREWLERNPQIRLSAHSRFGWQGQSFIVHLGA